MTEHSITSYQVSSYPELPRVLRQWANDPGASRASESLTFDLLAAADEIEQLRAKTKHGV